jgi:hypothetical protein
MARKLYAKVPRIKPPKDKGVIFGKTAKEFEVSDNILVQCFNMSMKKLPVSDIGYILGYDPDNFYIIRTTHAVVEYAITSGRSWGNKVIADILWTMLKEKNAPIVSLFAKACMGMGSPDELAKLLPPSETRGKASDINFAKMDAQEASRVYQDLMKGK